MFTSRAEYRLSLRADNADQRLTEWGTHAGIVGRGRAEAFAAKRAELERAREQMASLQLTPNEAQSFGIALRQDGVRRTASQLLALPEVDFAKLTSVWPALRDFTPSIVEQLEVDALYAGYLDRQQADIVAFRRDEDLRLPGSLDYRAVHGLSTEAVQKLERIRPATLGQAARIDGVTAAALTLVLAHVRALSRAA